jgi:hypothetical protein
MNETEKCFRHSGNDPVTKIKLQQCESSKKKCYMKKDSYAWIDSNY